jgi:hypothetical protein
MNKFLMIAALASLSAVTYAQQFNSGQLSPPPAHLAGLEKRGVAVQVSYSGVEGSLAYSMSGKNVTIWWRRDFSSYLPEIQSPPALSDGGFVSSQEMPVPYWPTEVCWFGENRVCVAGKTGLGKTRIELWEFAPSEELGEPYQDEGGTWHYPDTTIPIVSTQTLYEGNQAGKKLVRLMLANIANPQKLFVQFDDVRDLRELDIVTGQFTTVLTTTEQPMLSAGFVDRWSADHDEGHLYCLRGQASTGILMLIDTDRNGTLDPAALRLLTGDQWYAGAVDFSNPDLYIENY